MSVKNSFTVNGSERVVTTFLLASDKEYTLLEVRSNLKKSVVPVIFRRRITVKYMKNL